MDKMKDYAIAFIGLKQGKHHFEYHIDNTFFNLFEYTEFNSSNINVELEFEKKPTLLELKFKAKGSVNVNCDLSNEPYDQAIEGVFNLIVKFGEEFNDDNEEILIIPHGEYQINISQYIYELIVLSVPIKKVHPGVKDGTLNSDILKKLEELNPIISNKEGNTIESDPRWDSLKKLLTDK